MQLTYELIKSFNPCYEPEEIDITESYSATIVEFINEYRNKVKNKSDIIWVVCRNDFMPDQDLRLFAVWRARKVPHSMLDERSINALNIAELFAYGKATKEELMVAHSGALEALNMACDATWDVAWVVACASGNPAVAVARDVDRVVAWDAVRDAAWIATWDVARVVAWAVDHDMKMAYYMACNTQIDKLLSYFIAKENNLLFDWTI